MAEAKTQQWKKIKSHKKVQEALKKVQQKENNFLGAQVINRANPYFPGDILSGNFFII
jgi:hypothetical protein